MCHNFHSTYRRVLPWHNAKVTRMGFQWISLAIDVGHTSIASPFFLFVGISENILTYLMKSLVGT